MKKDAIHLKYAFEHFFSCAVSKQQTNQTSSCYKSHKALPQHKGPGPARSNKFIHSKRWLQEMISVKSVPHPQLSRVNYVFH